MKHVAQKFYYVNESVSLYQQISRASLSVNQQKPRFLTLEERGQGCFLCQKFQNRYFFRSSRTSRFWSHPEAHVFAVGKQVKSGQEGGFKLVCVMHISSGLKCLKSPEFLIALDRIACCHGAIVSSHPSTHLPKFRLVRLFKWKKCRRIIVLTSKTLGTTYGFPLWKSSLVSNIIWILCKKNDGVRNFYFRLTWGICRFHHWRHENVHIY